MDRKEAANTSTGEIVQLPQEINAIELYKNASTLQVTPDEQKKLEEPIDVKLVEIRPDGFLYLPQVFYREKLNSVFGIGQWALIQHRDIMRENKFFFDGSLLVRGCFISRSMGEANYNDNNDNQSWASALEAAKSDCLVRCCKDLGIGKEMWMPQFNKKWVEENAVKVWREKTGKSRDGKQGSYQWRRKDSEPYWDEKGAQVQNNKSADTKPANQEHKPADPSKPNDKPEENKNTDFDKALKAFHAAGKKLYGENWDKKRAEIVLAKTKKRKVGQTTSSSKECTIEELDSLTKSFNKKLDEQEKAIKDQHKKILDKESQEKIDVESSIYTALKDSFSKCDNGIDFINLLNRDSKLIDIVKQPELSAALTVLISEKARELKVDLNKAAA